MSNKTTSRAYTMLYPNLAGQAVEQLDTHLRSALQDLAGAYRACTYNSIGGQLDLLMTRDLTGAEIVQLENAVFTFTPTVT